MNGVILQEILKRWYETFFRSNTILNKHRSYLIKSFMVDILQEYHLIQHMNLIKFQIQNIEHKGV